MNLTTWIEEIQRILNTPLIRIGGGEFTPLSVVYFLALIGLLFYISRKLRSLMLDRLLPRSSLDISAQRAIAAVTNYLVLFIGMLIVLQTVGLDLTTLNVLAGAVGIGVGFGL